MSIFFIESMASITRFDLVGSGSASISPRTGGGGRPSSPSSDIRLQYRSTSSGDRQSTEKGTASLNLKWGRRWR